MASEVIDLSPVKDILWEYEKEPGPLIPVLQRVQEAYRWLPRPALEAIAHGMNVPLSQVYGVATFYSQFHLKPRGRHVIQQCDGTACHVLGAGRIIDRLETDLGMRAGETSPDLKYTYDVVYCLGSCALAPVAMVDGRIVGNLTPEKMLDILQDLD